MKSTLHTGQFLRLLREGRWEYVERVNATGAAVIIAVTPKKKLLLVEQYRTPCHSRTIELPAGIIGDLADESPAEGARRELREETGYTAGRMEWLANGPISAGMASEILTFFRALDLQRAGEGGGDGHEDITVHEVALAEVGTWLKAKAAAGLLIDPKIYAALHFISRSG